MSSPEKPPATVAKAKPSEAEIDALYGLEPVIDSAHCEIDQAGGTVFVTVHCPYCGEPFETNADASAGPSIYVEDCQICCQPIDMELRVDDAGAFLELLTRRGDS